MMGKHREAGLSEVVGFVLIIGVIIAAFSIYLTYGIPVQGRDNEIQHMGEVKDEFIGYKIGVDSLWTNDQTDTIMSTTIKMGTAGATSGGNSGFLPILQPVASGGTVAINQKTPAPEVLKIISYSYIQNQTHKKTLGPYSIPPSQNPILYDNPPDSLNLTLTGITNVGGTSNPARAVIVNGTDSLGIQWQAWINLTPRISYYQNYTSQSKLPADPCPTSVYGPVLDLSTSCLIPNNQYSYTGTDLTLTIIRNNTKTLSDFTLYKGISSSGTPYVIDLLDSPYGLSSTIRNTPSIWYTKYDPNSEITAVTSAQYAYQFQPKYTYSVPLGAVEYRANNYYWIPQTYYYQMGGVFLSQSDGIAPRLSPSISFIYNKSGPGPILVNVGAIAFDQGNSIAISGTTPIQIGTKLKSDSANLPYATIPANTMNVSINITSPTGDPHMLQMWKQYFEESANKTGGIPNNQDLYNVGNTTTEAYIFIKGAYDPTKSGGANAEIPDISLKAKAVNLTATILGTGGV